MNRFTLATLACLATGPALALDFTNPDEIRPILSATAANWIAVREWEGHDVIYFTHLMTYRCALAEVRFGVNGAPATELWQAEPCYRDEPVPFAQKSETHKPHTALDRYDLGSVQTIRVEITYPDGTVEGHDYDRAAVLIP